MSVAPALAAAQAPTFLPSLVTLAGNKISGYTDGPAASSSVSNTISAGTMDQAGNFYIADTKNNVIRKITPLGIVSTFAGQATGTTVCSGATNSVGDGCNALQATMGAPGSVRYHQGAIYITDFNNGRIRKVDLTTNIITTVAGGGSASLNNANPTGVGTNISIPQPQDTAFDNLGNLYWDQGGGTSRVDVLNLNTGAVSIFAGTGGTSGATGTEIGAAGSGRTSPENTALNGVMGLATDQFNNVYVVEYSTKVIRKITVGSVPTISTYAGLGINTTAVCAAATNSIGDGCSGPTASMGTIEHISIDGNGTIYVADSTNNRIRVIPVNPNDPTTGGTVYSITGNGSTTYSPDGTYASAATIGTPWDAQVLPSGDLLLMDRVDSLVRLLHYPGLFQGTAVGATTTQIVNVQTQAGTGTLTLSNTTDFAISGTPTCAPGVGVTGTVCAYTIVFQPQQGGVRSSQLSFTDANGTTVVGVSGMGVAPVASLLPGLASLAAGTSTSGATGDGAAASSATFTTPGAEAVDGLGNVYVADAGDNEVRKFTPGGLIVRVAGTGSAGSAGDGAAATAAQLNAPGGVAVDPAGNVYIADTGNNKIRVVSAATGKISTLAGSGTAGYTGDLGTPATATLSGPTQLAWSSVGTLYVADTGNSVVRAINVGENLISTAAGTTPGFDGDGAPAQAGELLSPQGVAVDGNNTLYIADTGNNRIRSVTNGIINTTAGVTSQGYNGDGTAAGATLTAPTGLAADAGGDVYVADTGNNRVRVISSGQIYTVMGGSTTGSSGNGGSSAAALLNGPTAVALDRTGDLFVADTGNHEIREVNVSTETLTFKTQNPTEVSTPQTVSVFDIGDSPLAVGSVVVPAGYVEQTATTGVSCTTAPITVAPGNSCYLNTAFNPPTIGPYNGMITIADNSQLNAAATQQIQLVATSAYVYTATLTLPATATAGAPVAGTVLVTNPQKTYTGTVTFTSTDKAAVLPANYTFATTDNGLKSIAVTFKTAGLQCVTVTDTSDPTVTSTACLNVGAAAAAKVVVYTGNNQTANINTLYGQRLVALVTDAFGNPVNAAPVTFTVVPNGATTGTFTGGGTTYSTTSVLGYASAAALTSGITVGNFTVSASINSTTSAPFTETVVILGSFTLTPQFASVTGLEPGSSSPVNITVNATGGFNAPIVFTCTAPTGTTCSVGPSPFSVATQSAIPAVLNFTSEGTLRNLSSTSSSWIAIVACVTGGLLFFRRRKLGTVIVAVLAVVALGAASGCSGTPYTPTTGTGTYVVTVTGTAQTVSASTQVSFGVQD